MRRRVRERKRLPSSLPRINPLPSHRANTKCLDKKQYVLEPAYRGICNSKTCGNTKHAMFGLLKVLAAIFYVIEDITFKTRHDTCRGSKKKKKKKGGSLCTKSKGGGTGLNTACSDSHGFRLVKSIDRVDTSFSSSSFALEIRPIQNLNEFHTLLIDLKIFRNKIFRVRKIRNILSSLVSSFVGKATRISPPPSPVSSRRKRNRYRIAGEIGT